MISNNYCVHDMNYQKIYDDLISKCQARQPTDGYKERHHIIPKSLGGSNDSSNLVDLTAREHFVAHFLLAKMHGGNQWSSIKRMRGNDNFYINSRLYEVARREVAKATGLRFQGAAKSIEQRAKMSAASKGKPKSPEAVEKTRKALLGRQATEKQLECLAQGRKKRPEGWLNPAKGKQRETPWLFGLVPYNKGVPASEETRAKLSAAGKGRKQTPEQIAKRVAARRATLEAQGRTV